MENIYNFVKQIMCQTRYIEREFLYGMIEMR